MDEHDDLVVAVRHQSSFNLVHFETGLKIDVFVATDSEYEAGVRARRVSEPIGDAGSTRRLWIASAEDTILAKLGWYRRGGGVSERQWRDVQGVIELRASLEDISAAPSKAEPHLAPQPQQAVT